MPALLTSLLIFLVSLVIVMGAAAWFTRRLEALCDRLDFSPGVLSALGALGANVPNYVASLDAIARHQTNVGLGIIIGSNIYNIAIILGIASLAAPAGKGIRLAHREIQDARGVGYYSLFVLLSVALLIWLLSAVASPAALQVSAPPLVEMLLRIALSLLALTIFAALLVHIARRSHEPHIDTAVGTRLIASDPSLASNLSLVRLGAEIVIALALALGGVVVMVQSGQSLAADLHMPDVLAGLLVLAVATSLPNTVVVVLLVRTGRAAACVEEIFSSSSVNAALGIALPLLFWRVIMIDHLLLILDIPLMIALTLGVLFCVQNGKVGRVVGVIFLLCYAGWVALHLL